MHCDVCHILRDASVGLGVVGDLLQHVVMVGADAK